MRLLLPLFLSSFLFVFLKAFQQRNVAFDKYKWILPTSYAMAAVEVFIIAEIATAGYGFWVVFAVGTGAGTGALLAAYAHKRLFDESEP